MESGAGVEVVDEEGVEMVKMMTEGRVVVEGMGMVVVMLDRAGQLVTSGPQA